MRESKCKGVHSKLSRLYQETYWFLSHVGQLQRRKMETLGPRIVSRGGGKEKNLLAPFNLLLLTERSPLLSTIGV